MPSSLYYDYMHRAFEHHLTRCPVRIAHPKGEPDHIIGMLVADPSKIGLIVHYLGVRRDFDQNSNPAERRPIRCYRRQGIARKLVTSMLDQYEKDPELKQPRHIHYTIRMPIFYRNEAFRAKVDIEMESEATYNQFLFERVLPYQWEKGLG